MVDDFTLPARTGIITALSHSNDKIKRLTVINTHIFAVSRCRYELLQRLQRQGDNPTVLNYENAPAVSSSWLINPSASWLRDEYLCKSPAHAFGITRYSLRQIPGL